MQRTKINRKPSIIFCSDFHARETIPLCRTDDFESALWNKIDEISQLQKIYDCMVVHAGDLFDHWKPSPYLLTKAIEHLPNKFYTVYGQHDIPQYNLKLAKKCGINVLKAAKRITVLSGTHWGQIPKQPSHIIENGVRKDLHSKRKILVWHKMNYKGKLPWPGCKDPSSISLLKKYPEYDVIVTGDNHKSFIEEYDGRILINPGSLMRMDADQIEHEPSVYLWYADTNKVERHILKYNPNVISREHIKDRKERDKRISTFVSMLNSNWKIKIKFRANLIEFEKANNIDKKIMQIIFNSIEPLTSKRK